MYTQTVNVGREFENLKKCIVILLTDYNLEKLKNFPDYLTKWNIREEKYQNLVLTNVLELYIISLNKAKNCTKSKQNELYNWLQFINNPKEVTRSGK